MALANRHAAYAAASAFLAFGLFLTTFNFSTGLPSPGLGRGPGWDLEDPLKN